MKNRLLSHILLVLLSTVLLSCSQRHGTVSVMIVATSDVHGHIFDIDAVTGEHRDGSLAKVSSFLTYQRKANRNVLYVDCGDVLQGSIETYRDITAEFYKPCLASDAFNLLDCKAIAMGNHDLMVGTDSYYDYFVELECPVLWGNLGFTAFGDYMPAYKVVEVDGVRIAFLGLTTPNVEYTIPADIMGELGVGAMEEAARRWIPVLREKERADVIVGILHAGVEKCSGDSISQTPRNLPQELVSSVSGFDLIIYGHDHQSGIFRVTDADGDSLWLANPGPYAASALVADISLDFKSSDSPEPVISVRIEDLTGLEPDRKFLNRLSDRWSDVCEYADSVVGSLETPIDAQGALWRATSALDYLHSFQMDFQGAEVSLISYVQDTVTIEAGLLEMRDFFRIYPFDNNMVSLMLKGSEINSILEYSADRYYNTYSDDSGLLKLSGADGSAVFEEPANRFLTAAGIKYTVNVTRPYGSRVTIESMSDGTPFSMDRYYRTTVTSFLFGGTESVLPLATGLSGRELQRRLNVSSKTDLKYYMVSQASLSGEQGYPVRIPHIADWELVPQETALRALARDTVRLNFESLFK